MNTQLQSLTPYQSQNLDVSYRTFTFDMNAFNFDHTLECDVKICIKSDLEKGTCGMGGKMKACSAGYHAQI